ncbi:MAG TPA: TraR/DksA family transcriptional regulator [Polyangia bacterium]|nr:TraR/DksA family transcriptional regulator [Polyangia bacterium]
MRQSQERDAAGLTGNERSKLKLELERERAAALGELKSAEASARAAEAETEPMDAAEMAREQGDGAIFVARTREHLHEVEDAIAKIAEGRYGLSERSGRPIGYDRLAAVPWARFAVDEE